MQTGIKEEAIGHTGHAAEREGLILATVALAAVATVGGGVAATAATGVVGAGTVIRSGTGTKTEAKTRLTKRETPGASNPKDWNI